ncbi:amidohydrolase [Anatilimnocola sp. NA78]|uniref:amidohydrolase n=1 Tax=Anatilimnocola sp. NA78 TaxID=3415683 RepID=UPI003CE57151
MTRCCALLFLAMICFGAQAQEKEPAQPAIPAALLRDVQTKVDAEYASLEKLYQHLHSHPELSLAEENTAARIAQELKDAHCEVTTGVGGHGVVGVMKNGAGPTIMLRADMDALPIAERTKLPYASQVRTRDHQGRDVGVMHACGHDVNMTCLVGVARLLHEFRSQWQGTLVFVGQPAEEIGSGARMMLADGLFHRFPRPEKCYALHCDARFPHGQVNYRSGQMQANVDTVDIVVLGKGGHGAAPHTTIDPVVIASRIVVDLQTIVSRELDPLDAAVVTVGSIHGGTKHNVIPSDVKLQLTVRTTNDKSRQHVLEAIRRIAKSTAASARAPEPTITVDEDQFTPALVNDPEITAATVVVLKKVLGADRVHERPMSLGGEDFSRFVLAGVPGCYYFLGTAPPEKVSAARNGGEPLPLTHTDLYYPVPEPTIKTGLLSMTAVLLNATKPVTTNGK